MPRDIANFQDRIEREPNRTFEKTFVKINVASIGYLVIDFKK